MQPTTEAPGRPAGRTPAPTARLAGRVRDLPLGCALGAAMVVAFLVRLHLITHGAAIAASDDYDDGVYYAAADALVHGRLPYRDFLLLHPPGVVLALAPFAALGSALGDPVGVATGRLAFIAVGAVNTGLIGAVAARHSRTAAVVAAGCAAVFFPLAYSERSTLLEPLGTLLTLAAVLVARRFPSARGTLVAGALAGLAIDVKAWYVVPALLLGVLAERYRVRFLLGAAGAAAVVALPFLLAAPTAMVREVVLDQLGRPRTGGPKGLLHRVVTIGSDPSVVVHGIGPHHATLLAAAVLALVAVAAVAAWTVPWARLLVVLTAVTGAVLIAGPSFFPHYAAFTAPWMLATLGIGTAEAARRLRMRGATVGAAVLVVAVVAGVSARADLVDTVSPQPVAAVRAALAHRSGCVLSDDPGLLADADVLSADLQRGCPLWPDVTGWTYDRDAAPGGASVPRPRNARWQHDVLAYLTSGSTVVLARKGTGLSAASMRDLARLPLIASSGPVRIRAVNR